MRLLTILLCALLGFGTARAAAEAAGPPGLRAEGSDTLQPLLEAWAAAYATGHPGWSLSVGDAGSAAAPPLLTAGKIDLAPMSRPMTAAEVEAFTAARGHAPLAVAVAMDAIAVIVHPGNPVQGLTLQQLDDIFGSGQRCGGRPVTRWRQLALAAPDAVIHPNGRHQGSGTYGLFRELALCGGPYRDSVAVHLDSRDIVAAVAGDPQAIGYVGLGYREEGVRALALGRGEDPEDLRFYPFIVDRFRDSADPVRKYAYVFDGRYPLSRPLLIYVDRPDGRLSPDVAGFLRFLLTTEGQAIVEAEGYVPLSGPMLASARAALAGGRPDGSWSWRPWD